MYRDIRLVWNFVKSWEFVKLMVILHKSIHSWVRSISIILNFAIYLDALNITSMYLNSCEHHLCLTNHKQFVQKNISFSFDVSSSCLGYIITWRPDRETLVISLGQSNLIESQTHILIFLGNLIHVLRENKRKTLKSCDKLWFMKIDNDNHWLIDWCHQSSSIVINCHQ